MSLSPPPLESDVQKQVDDVQAAPTNSEFPCKQCGASLVFKPGVNALSCPYCGCENLIEASEQEIKELDFKAYLKQELPKLDSQESLFIKCDSCGAESSTEANVTSQSCPFCDSPIVATAQSKKLLKPKSLLPFKISKGAAKKSYSTWLNKLWFAPNALKKRAKLDVPISGVYVPYWTYDANTASSYRGQRGTYYYTNETRTRKNANGEEETYTERVRHTRWTYVSGRVYRSFDDVLIVASKSLPRKYMRKLEPWDLDKLLPYQDEYLSGFRCESYQVGLEEGFNRAKELMDDEIRDGVRSDIGGDEQRISSVSTQHNDVTFKHILLPVWLSAYKYRNKVYRFMVNARTGEVQGERPWSWLKISMTVIAVLALAAVAYIFSR